MKVWPIDPLVPRNLRLEVPEKLPQGSAPTVVPVGIRSASPTYASGSGDHPTRRRRVTARRPNARQDAGPVGLLVRAVRPAAGDGVRELACGSQAFIATLLFDPSMSALPIIPKQNSVSVGLFTH